VTLPGPTSHQVRFGEFILDLETAELRKNGYQSTLQGQPFQILLILLEQPGRLVTRDELKKRLWPSDTFVDFDHGLNKAVNRLREALDDSADHPKFIETLPRRGYRFIGNINEPAATSQQNLASPEPYIEKRWSAFPIRGQRRLKRDSDSGRISSSSTRAVQELPTELPTVTANRTPAVVRGRQYAILAACIALSAVAFVAYRFWPRANSLGGLAKITQISQWNKPMNDATLSPDGHAVAFTSTVGGTAQVFLMLTSGGEPLQLTNDEGDKIVNTFSLDGKEIYYERNLGSDGIWAVPTLGGSPRLVTSGRDVVPSSDGSSIFYGKGDGSGIFRAAKSGLNEELVYNSKGTGLFFYPFLLFPGGNDLLTLGSRRDSLNVRIFKINLTSHEAVDLGEISPTGSGLRWAEPGKTLLFSRTAKGLTNIWSYNLKDGSLTQITFGTGSDFSPMPDPGGKGIYYVNGKSSAFLTAYHVHSKQSTDIVSEDATQPAISLDGKRVMYTTLPAPRTSELWVSDIDGGKKVKIARGEGLGTGNWAPDNFHLSFQEVRTDAADQAYIVSADGSGLRQLPTMGGTPSSTVWSPDQKAIYVSIQDKVGQTYNIWRWSVGGSTTEKFVDNCGQVSDIDPGGGYLLDVVWLGEKTGIYEVSTSDRKCIPLLPGVVTFNAFFARDGKSFLYAIASRGEVTIYRQFWRDGKLKGVPQVALKVPFAFPLQYATGNAYDFSRDLSTIVYARPGGQADLYLLSQK
jgi:DNA-binding winged helix-turn-helix (wHTH) protein/Tol biopolymer transport system component